MQIRILPIAIFSAVLLLGVKLGSLWTGVEGIVVTPSHAQQAASGAVSSKGKANSKAKGKKPTAGDGKTVVKAKTDGTGDKPVAPKKGGLPEDPTLFTQAEINLLQKLADRHNKLEQWTRDLSMREQLLHATEQRIEKKVGELTAIQTKVKGMLRQYDKEQEDKLKSLVKIYEKMKPKDAARIFMELEMPILLDVIERMSETRAAPIIAKMQAVKAKNITAQLATRRKFRKPSGKKLPSSAPK